jgi:4-alpha-glucanotransferase
MNSKEQIDQLFRLARLYNVQTAYYGVRHHRHTATADSLLEVLTALDAPITSLSDVNSALRECTRTGCEKIMEPVTVAWNGERPVITITLPAAMARNSCEGRLELEPGESTEWKIRPTDLTPVKSIETDGLRYTVNKLILPQNLPFGYHKFFFKAKEKTGETLIISAPRRIYSPDNGKNNRAWGAFLPLYALKTKYDWGSGDYSGLSSLSDWVAEEGGNVVGTLPLLPAFLDKPYDPSPYAPVSRLMWNEFYVDVNKIPELAKCQQAQEALHEASFKAEIERMRGLTLADYRGVMTVKRKVMEQLSKFLSDTGATRFGELRRFIKENPLVEDYARFRAVMEKQDKPWGFWPERLRDGVLDDNDWDADVKNYHLYAQWQAWQQIDNAAEKARQKGAALYFDLPLGVHPDGYDVWRQGEIFAKDVAAGAPPDPVFTTGQNWGFPPLHPEKIRAQGYRYVRDYIHHHLQYAAMLRIDHVMGLHRLYWIPRGIEAKQGVYVHYHAEEFYAILALESHRHRSIIVGEDLGIVPSYVRQSMARHGLHRMYILYYELADNAARTPRNIPSNCIAALNTHDMAPFAAFWEGSDIREKISSGLLSEKESAADKEDRRTTKTALTNFLKNNNYLQKEDNGTGAALKACLAYLSASEASTVLINLEDLWRETRSQNIPGSGDKFPNWQRKARYCLEEFCRLPEVSDILKKVNSLREGEKEAGE